MDTEVILGLQFVMKYVDCISYRCVKLSYWNKVVKFLKSHDIEVSVMGGESPIEIESETLNSKALLERIEVISHYERVAGFKAFHGAYFNSDIDIFDQIFEKVDEVKPPIFLEDEFKAIFQLKDGNICIEFGRMETPMCREDRALTMSRDHIDDDIQGVQLQIQSGVLNFKPEYRYNSTGTFYSHSDLWKLYQKRGLDSKIAVIFKDNTDEQFQSEYLSFCFTSIKQDDHIHNGIILPKVSEDDNESGVQIVASKSLTITQCKCDDVNDNDDSTYFFKWKDLWRTYYNHGLEIQLTDVDNDKVAIVFTHTCDNQYNLGVLSFTYECMKANENVYNGLILPEELEDDDKTGIQVVTPLNSKDVIITKHDNVGEECDGDSSTYRFSWKDLWRTYYNYGLHTELTDIEKDDVISAVFKVDSDGDIILYFSNSLKEITDPHITISFSENNDHGIKLEIFCNTVIIGYVERILCTDEETFYSWHDLWQLYTKEGCNKEINVTKM